MFESPRRFEVARPLAMRWQLVRAKSTPYLSRALGTSYLDAKYLRTVVWKRSIIVRKPEYIADLQIRAHRNLDGSFSKSHPSRRIQFLPRRQSSEAKFSCG